MNLYADLCGIVRMDQVTKNDTERAHHSLDESHHRPQLPDVVVFPENTADVVAVLRYASEHGVPVIPFAVGSSLEGLVIPVRGGISLDMMRMNQIREIRSDDFLVCVEPGVRKEQLNAALKRFGLFFSVDPGADASIGGMAATNASGTTTVRYGVMRDQVRALEIVLPDGRIIHTGSLAAKSSSGYHLNGLFVGSEGTLGVITELWLRVYGLPESISAASATFPSVAECVDTAVAVMGAGIPVARMELIDEATMRGVNRYRNTSFPEAATLFFEFHGNASGLQQDVAAVREIAAGEGSTSFSVETSEEGRKRLWESRHISYLAFRALFPGKRSLATDICVPLTELAGAVSFTRELLDKTGMIGGIVGHAGDGNFHAQLIIDPDVQSDVEKAHEIVDQLVHYALERGGTCTGEHGVGIGKRAYQSLEHGSSLELMRSIKQLIDPHNIMNPGKLVGD